MHLPTTIFSGHHGANHCQGIAIDEKNGYIYFSFTTKLVKCRLDGTPIGSVDGLIGHLGCIDFNEQDGRVSGSLEFKNDRIGRGILKTLHLEDTVLTNAFYCAVFDADKIDREGLDAARDGIMRVVYLPEVVADYEAEVLQKTTPYPHKYACSGIDGTAFGPAFGQTDGKQFLHICYGIYGDTAREDNDYQVILRFDAADWWHTLATPLTHHTVPQDGATSLDKYFVYTGNTTYGVQNLLYDKQTGDWLAAVYPGKKPQFPNYTMFVIDGHVAPEKATHNAYGETIKALRLKGGSYFPLGATGMATTSTGCYYFSQEGHDEEKGQYTTVHLYQKNDAQDMPFLPVSE